MNARHLFRYARYALAALASVGFSRHQLSADLAGTRPPHHGVTESIRTGCSTSPLHSSRR